MLSQTTLKLEATNTFGLITPEDLTYYFPCKVNIFECVLLNIIFSQSLLYVLLTPV